MLINQFRGSYRFLSNFFETPVTYEGITYRCSEGAFQASKFLDEEARRQFINLDGRDSKSKGKRSVMTIIYDPNGVPSGTKVITLRPDWEQVKDQVMYDIIKSKFSGDEYLKCLLVQTKGLNLVEGNTWCDNYWGACICSKCKSSGKVGKNMLGKILMQVREELSNGNY